MKKEELGCLILGASGFQAAVDNEENDVIGKTLHDIWREAIKQRKRKEGGKKGNWQSIRLRGTSTTIGCLL